MSAEGRKSKRHLFCCCWIRCTLSIYFHGCFTSAGLRVRPPKFKMSPWLVDSILGKASRGGETSVKSKRHDPSNFYTGRA